jgi:hypothetical protein
MSTVGLVVVVVAGGCVACRVWGTVAGGCVAGGPDDDAIAVVVATVVMVATVASVAWYVRSNVTIA